MQYKCNVFYFFLILFCTVDIVLCVLFFSSLQQQLLSKKQTDLDAMKVSEKSLSSELGTELMADLNDEDQRDVSIECW